MKKHRRQEYPNHKRILCNDFALVQRQERHSWTSPHLLNCFACPETNSTNACILSNFLVIALAGVWAGSINPPHAEAQKMRSAPITKAETSSPHSDTSHSSATSK